VFIRQTADGKQYGAEALDPLMWWQTRHLLTGESHSRALQCLDEFLRAQAEHLVADPLKHAILRHDLWAVFDWAAAGDDFPQQRHDLEVRLAAAIYCLAITAQQAQALPDTYGAAVEAIRIHVRFAQSAKAVPPSRFVPAERPLGLSECSARRAQRDRSLFWAIQISRISPPPKRTRRHARVRRKAQILKPAACPYRKLHPAIFNPSNIVTLR
jgi:hypothetical protein